MSAEIRVFIKRIDMLNIEQWISAFSEYGFDLKFDCELDVFKDNGFIPMVYKGESCGFEYGFDNLEDTMFSIDENQEIAGKDICVSFSSEYDQSNLASAMIASAVLVKKCSGIYWIMDSFELDNDPINMARNLEENGFE
ncbi:MAG: hypothetical protein AB8B80_11550 [Marinicellaceae bacterium]